MKDLQKNDRVVLEARKVGSGPARELSAVVEKDNGKTVEIVHCKNTENAWHETVSKDSIKSKLD